METTTESCLGPFVANIYGDRYLHMVNRNSFVKLCADDVYKGWGGKEFFKENSFYLVAGTDCGLLIKYLCRTGLPDGTKFVFVEPEEVLERLPEVLDFERLDPNIKVIVPQDLETAFDEFGVDDYLFSERVYLIKALCAQDSYYPIYQEVHGDLQKQMEEIQYRAFNTLIYKRYVIKQLENLPENRFNANCLKDLFKGKSSIILGVGPSLDDIIPWAKANRDDLVIIAVSRASRRLHKEGLVPHIVVSIDPTDFSFDVSREMMHFWKDTLFVHADHVSSPLLGQWPGRSLYTGRRFPWETDANGEVFEMSGPTVTQAAVSLAQMMGFSQVLLAGIDLCFGKEGEMYAASTKGHEKGAQVGSISGGVETNGGWRAESIPPFVQGIEVMEEIAANALEKGFRIINSAAGAAKMENIAYVPPEEFRFEPLGRPAEEILSEGLPEEDRKSRIESYQAALDELSRARNIIRQIEVQAEKGLKANKGLFGKAAEPANYKYKKKLDNIEKRLRADFADFNVFIKCFGVGRFVKVIQPNSENFGDEEVERTWKEYFDAYLATSGQLFDLIDETESRLLVRLEEEADRPDVNRIVRQWEKDKQYGRVRIWRTRRPELLQGVDCETQSGLEDLEGKFRRIMALEEDLAPAQAKEAFDAAKKRSEARWLFARKDARALRILAKGLADSEESKAESLQHLVRGFLAELEGEPDVALMAYEGIVAECMDDLLEDALPRIVSISIAQNNYDNVLLGLECLYGVSPVYAPKYADALWIMGRQGEALDVYADYLGQVPDDLVSMLKLGKYYLQLNSPESAAVAFRYVLEKDPENRTAKKLLEASAVA